MPDLKLNEAQEEATCEMYRNVGFQECHAIIDKYLIENFGEQHKHRINFRLLIQPIIYERNDNVRKLVDESELTELFMRRMSNEKT